MGGLIRDSACFRFLSLDVCIEGPGHLLDPYRRVFAAFLVSESRPGLEILISRQGDSFDVSVRERTDIRELSLPSEDLVFGCVYATVLDKVATADPALLCVHAAAVERSGTGMILPAESEHGKTTLALALRARGFRVYSDEIAPIDRETGLLQPFPMASGCRAGGFQLLASSRTSDAPGSVAEALGKRFIDAAPDSDAPRVPVETVVFIESEWVGGPVRHYRMKLDRVIPGLPSEVHSLDGVVGCEWKGSWLHVDVESNAWVAPRIERILRGSHVRVVEDLDRPRPDFNRAPELEPLPTLQGVVGLLGNLRGFGYLDVLAKATDGGFSSLMLELVDLFSSTTFFRLSTGRLPDMVEALDGVARKR